MAVLWNVLKEENTINFNYYIGNELVNIKYRDGAKNFKLYKGAEKVFYNIDNIAAPKAIHPGCMTWFVFMVTMAL